MMARGRRRKTDDAFDAAREHLNGPERPTRKHNSEGAIDAEALKRYVSRVSALMEDQAALARDIAEVCTECDEAGVASKRELRRLARESLMETDVLQAQLERMDALRHALGAFITTPLGAAAAEAGA